MRMTISKFYTLPGPLATRSRPPAVPDGVMQRENRLVEASIHRSNTCSATSHATWLCLETAECTDVYHAGIEELTTEVLGAADTGKLRDKGSLASIGAVVPRRSAAYAANAQRCTGTDKPYGRPSGDAEPAFHVLQNTP